MRIIAGKLKGSGLLLPESSETRPLKDLVRESIFNLLTHSKKISLKLEQSNILDLYSGTGSFGLECLSRNAKCVYFVENEELAFKILEKNIKKLKLEKKTQTFFNDVFNMLEKNNIFDLKFDFIFCDPPFKIKNINNLIELIFNKNLLKNDGIVLLHRDKAVNEKFPHFFEIFDERIYGRSKIIFAKFLS